MISDQLTEAPSFEAMETSEVPAIFQQDLDLVALEWELAKLPQVEAPVQHDFSDGIYVRTIFIPKDSLIIGKRHRLETCNILLKGEISVYMGKGEPVVRLKAPCIFNSKPGVKKMGYTHEDTLFANVHPTQERDVDEIEKIFIVSEEEYTEGLICHGEQ